MWPSSLAAGSACMIPAQGRPDIFRLVTLVKTSALSIGPHALRCSASPFDYDGKGPTVVMGVFHCPKYHHIRSVNIPHAIANIASMSITISHASCPTMARTLHNVKLLEPI